MKLLDIMKKYDRCLVRESAKLTKIYNMILKESETDESLSEETCPECGNDPCTCDETECNECGDTPDVSKKDDENIKDSDVNESPIPDEEFFKPVKEGEGCENGKCDEEEEEQEISAEEFFSESEEKSDETDESDETDGTSTDDDEFMSAAEFFAEAEKECDESEEDVNEEIEIQPDAPMIDAKELLPETEEKKLEESLKSYRRKNHRLFNP